MKGLIAAGDSKAETAQTMSFMIFKVKCKKCKYVFDTAFGLVGTRLIAQPAKKCPKCRSKEIKSVKNYHLNNITPGVILPLERD